MGRLVGIAGLIALCVGCSNFPPGGPTEEERLYGPPGSLSIELDSVAYSTTSAIAHRTSAALDAAIVETLTGKSGKAYLTIEFRVNEPSFDLWRFIVRIGEIDSTARFYEWAMRDPSFRMDLKLRTGAMSGTFGGWLQGTGRTTFGTQILVRRGTMNVPFE